MRVDELNGLLLPLMNPKPEFSIVVPVYNRPAEVDELLNSLTLQTYKRFEVLLIEDGSSITAKAVYEKYATQLTIQYFFKPNSGPGPSRNFGFQHATGNYFIVFDSDCIVPPHYLEVVHQTINERSLDAWGGPDRGHSDFTPIQQAMAYTMSSVLTTGGIRGGKTRIGSFQPRSFNMGMSREVYLKTGGFKFDRYAEDIELSIRMKKAGFKVDLISEAYVFHKRRTSLTQFFYQVSNFGKGRALIGKAHPGEIKITHWFPAFFTAGIFLIPMILIIEGWMGKMLLSCYLLYLLLICCDAWRKTSSLKVALLSVPAVLVQMTGYGLGFFKEMLLNK